MKIHDLLRLATKLDHEKLVLVTKTPDEREAAAYTREAEVKIVRGHVVVYPSKRW